MTDRIELNWRTGQWEVSQEARQAILMAARWANDNRDGHRLFGQRLSRVIRTQAVYMSYTGSLMENETIAKGEAPVIAKESYVAVAWNTSSGNTQRYVTPHGTFVAPTKAFLQTGVRVGWDDAANYGWDTLAQGIRQAGEELAAKKDGIVVTTLKAAVSGTAQSVTAPALTKGLFEWAVRHSASAGFTVNRLVCSQARAMDMMDWGIDPGSAWGPLPGRFGEEIARQGRVDNYFGVAVESNPSAPDNFAYFTSDPGTSGRIWYDIGGLRSAMEDNIDNRTTRHAYDQEVGYVSASSNGLYVVQFT